MVSGITIGFHVLMDDPDVAWHDTSYDHALEAVAASRPRGEQPAAADTAEKVSALRRLLGLTPEAW